MTTPPRILAALGAALVAAGAGAAEPPCEHCHPAKSAAAPSAHAGPPGDAAAPAAPSVESKNATVPFALSVGPRSGPESKGARVELADVTLLDQHGAAVPFRALVSGDRLVVVDFVFTSCTTVCPVLSAIMARLQARLGERVGKDVLLVSISIDPVRDTPGRLEAYAARFAARPGWTWLTGSRGDVDRVLQGMGAYAASFADHAPMILVGDGRAGAWTRFNGFPQLDQVLARLDALAADRARLARATPVEE